MRLIESSTAIEWDDSKQTFTITHPFHPLHGSTFELVHLRQNWGESRAYFLDASGGLASIPSCWTNLCAPDPLLAMAGGKSIFHAIELARLASLLKEMES